MASTSQHRCVFVGNIPYDATEEQLVQICEEVGPVVSFRLVLDRETGKPKGYGFCEYKDEETALSARRNLQGYEINGRQLRVDFAENDKGTDRNREQVKGRGGPGLMSNIDAQKASVAPSILGNSAIHQPLGLQLAETAASVMAGFLGGGQNRQTSGMPGFPSQSGFGNDPLSQYLAKMSRNHLHELMSEMKALVTQNKALAQQLLQNNPQFTKALFQAQIMLGMVTPQMLQIPHIRQSGSSLVQPQVFNGAQRPVSQPHNSQEPENMSQIGSLFRPQGDQMPILMQNPLIPPPSALPPRHMPMQPRSQLPNVPQPQFPIQGATAGRSGVPVDPSIQISSFSSKPSSVPSAASTGLISMQPPVSQQPRYVVESLGNNSQQVFPSASTHQQPVLPHESSLLGSSNYLRTSGGVETSPANSGKPASVGYSSAWDPKTSLGVQTDVPNGALEPTNHPSKFARLEDGSRALPRSNTSVAASAPSQPLPAAPTVSADGMQPKQKQISQILPGVETDLLQQVMNLTPEQLSLLPADQREQVIQLQQMLRS